MEFWVNFCKKISKYSQNDQNEQANGDDLRL